MANLIKIIIYGKIYSTNDTEQGIKACEIGLLVLSKDFSFVLLMECLMVNKRATISNNRRHVHFVYWCACVKLSDHSCFRFRHINELTKVRIVKLFVLVIFVRSLRLVAMRKIRSFC